MYFYLHGSLSRRILAVDAIHQLHQCVRRCPGLKGSGVIHHPLTLNPNVLLVSFLTLDNMNNTAHPRLRKSTKVDPEIMARSLESNTAYEQDSLLREEDGRERNGEEPTGLRDTNYPGSKRAMFLGNSVLRVIKITLGCSYSNLLLPFVFLGIIAGSQGWDDSISFVFNFLAILPLAALLSFATEELAKSVGQTVGGLINATFGNAVEMIVSGRLTLC